MNIYYGLYTFAAGLILWLTDWLADQAFTRLGRQMREQGWP